MDRKAQGNRHTTETQITASLCLDGSGKRKLHTGIRFFDHMLDGFARHGLFDLEIDCRGDVEVDCHHSIEDTGIVLGSLIREAVGDKKGIRRYGHVILPMDEALVLCAVDLSGRPYFVYDAHFSGDRCGEMDTQMAREFFYAVSYAAGMNLHMGKMTTISWKRCLRHLEKHWTRHPVSMNGFWMSFRPRVPYRKQKPYQMDPGARVDFFIEYYILWYIW